MFGVLVVGNKLTLTPPFSPIPFNQRDDDIMQYFSHVASIGFRCYQQYLNSAASAVGISNLNRMLTHTSHRNLDEAAAAVRLGNYDYFSRNLRPSPEHGSRPSSKPRVSTAMDPLDETCLMDKGMSSLVSPPHLQWVRDFRSGESNTSFNSKRLSLKSLDSFCPNDDREEQDDLEYVRHPTVGFPAIQSRTASQLRLITLSGQSSPMESIIGKFGELYFNLLNSTSLSHLLDEAQTAVKEFLGASFSYVGIVSAENNGSLVIGDSILNLVDLPNEVKAALDWGTMTEILSPSVHFSSSPTKVAVESLRIPGVRGTAALVVPLSTPQDFDMMESDAGSPKHSEMSRLLIISKVSGRFSNFEKDSVELFVKILSEAATHVAFRDSSGDIHVHNKVKMLDNFSNLEKSFSLLIGFDGEFILGSRDLSDVFGDRACSGHYTSWIDSKNEHLLRDIFNAIENEKGVAREDYLLTTQAGEKGSGIALDYSVLPLVDSYYACTCIKCCGRSPRPQSAKQAEDIKQNVCLRKVHGDSFVVLTAKAASQSMVEYRSFCRAPSSNPAGWFDDAPSMLLDDIRNSAIIELRRSRSRMSEVGQCLPSSAGYSSENPRPILAVRSRSLPDMERTGARSMKISVPQDSKQLKAYTTSTSPEDICTWDFNVLLIENKGLLRRVVYQCFSIALNFAEVHVDAAVLQEYIKEVSGMYKEVIFHNFWHATCITHATLLLFRETESVIELPKPLKFGLLLSALVHDVHHPGNTNLFEINSKSDLAILYNDQSVLENHHCSTAFRLMAKPGLNVLGYMSSNDQRDVRKLMIASIMATDMSKHSDLMEETAVRANHPASWNTTDLAEQIFYSKILLHAADLSNPTRNFPAAFQWATLIAAEFNEQTKLEVAAGLPVLSFMVSPDDITIVKNEISFSAFVVAPMWRGLSNLFPQLTYIVDNLNENVGQYTDMLEELESATASSKNLSERA